jgi:hypothetical protein
VLLCVGLVSAWLASTHAVPAGSASGAFAAAASVSSSAPAATQSVVARIGERELPASEVTERLSEVGRFQLEAWGGGARAIRHFVEHALVPELQKDAEAKRRNLGQTPRVRATERELLRAALDEALFAEASEPLPSEAELRAFYEKHSADYNRPRAIRVFRIVARSKADADKVLSAARAKDGLEAWRKLARESVDQATRLREGDLGFVREDGATDAPQLRVDPAVFRAVDAVRDGELVAEPLEQAGNFWVLWRRGTRPALEEPFDTVKDSIVGLVLRARVAEARGKLLARLRVESLRDFAPQLVDDLVTPSFDAGPVLAVLPLKAHAARDPKAPASSERGLR